jgi:hypothetical protein
MRPASRLLSAAAAALVLLPVGEASAACTRRIVNRSVLTLVASQDGGPPFVLPPGHARAIRLAEPGQIDMMAYCSGALAGAPAAEIHLPYEAVQDRCYIEIGTNYIAKTFGRGTFGLQGTGPFAVNAPRQGDVVLGPAANESCLVR